MKFLDACNLWSGTLMCKRRNPTCYVAVVVVLVVAVVGVVVAAE